MKKALAIVLGFLVAPIVPASYFAIVYPISGYQDFISILGTFVVAYSFAVTGTAFLGAPIFFLLNKFELVRWWSATGFGAVAGVVIQVVITSGKNNDFEPLRLFMTLGWVTGFVFWLFLRIGK